MTKFLAAVLVLGVGGGAALADPPWMRGRPIYPAPQVPYPVPGYPPPHGGYPGHLHPNHGYPTFAAPAMRPGDLEKHLERCLKARFGHCVKDVDVDVDGKKRKVEIEIETRHPHAVHEIQAWLGSLPELYGYHVCLEVDD
jgi:hypothetical protein